MKSYPWKWKTLICILYLKTHFHGYDQGLDHSQILDMIYTNVYGSLYVDMYI